MWPFRKNRQFVDDLIKLSDRTPGAWKILNEYRVEIHGVQFWQKNGRRYFQPVGGILPTLNTLERRRLWKAYRRSYDRMTLAEMLA